MSLSLSPTSGGGIGPHDSGGGRRKLAGAVVTVPQGGGGNLVNLPQSEGLLSGVCTGDSGCTRQAVPNPKALTPKP